MGHFAIGDFVSEKVVLIAKGRKTILQKLKNKAMSKGIPFQLMLQLFCEEEFLRRVEMGKLIDLK